MSWILKKIQHVSRYDTAANFSAANATYAAGEITCESDTKIFKVHDGSTAYNSVPAIGGTGSATPSGTGGVLQRTDNGSTLTSDTRLAWDNTAKSLKLSQISYDIHAAGAVTSPWVVPAAQFCPIITASASTDLTVRVPTSFTPTAGKYMEWLLRITNSHASNVILVTFDTGVGQYSYFWRPPVPEILPSQTREFVIAWTGAAFVVRGRDISPYDIKCFVAGVPSASSVIWEEYIHAGGGSNPGIIVPFNLADVGTTTLATAPSGGSVAFSIQRQPSGSGTFTEFGTCTFASGNAWSTWSFPSGRVQFYHGDVLRIQAPSNLYSAAGLRFIMRAVV